MYNSFVFSLFRSTTRLCCIALLISVGLRWFLLQHTNILVVGRRVCQKVNWSIFHFQIHTGDLNFVFNFFLTHFPTSFTVSSGSIELCIFNTFGITSSDGYFSDIWNYRNCRFSPCWVAGAKEEGEWRKQGNDKIFRWEFCAIINHFLALKFFVRKFRKNSLIKSNLITILLIW